MGRNMEMGDIKREEKRKRNGKDTEKKETQEKWEGRKKFG